MLPILRSRFDELERQRRAFLDDLGALSQVQLAYRPAPDVWSIAYVVQHLVLVEESTLQFLTKKPPRLDTRSLAQRIRYRAFRAWAPSSIRIKAPIPSILPTVDASLDELVPRWGAARVVLEGYLDAVPEAQLKLLVMKHPLGGPLTTLETLEMFRAHVVHHGHQLRRIKRSNGFPLERARAMAAGAGA